MRNRAFTAVIAAGILSLGNMGPAVWADGTETLGPPSIPILSGSGIASAGTGMLTQPSAIALDVPAGSTVKQVLLYWEGFNLNDGPGDDTILVGDGTSFNNVTGTLIGGVSKINNTLFASSFRADITALGLVTAGSNSLTLQGLEFSKANNGAGVMVIYEEAGAVTELQIRDGSDFAYHGSPGPEKDRVVPQTYSFPSDTSNRVADLDMFFGSVSGTASSGDIRPSVIEIRVTGPGINQLSKFDNVLDSVDGEEWDTFHAALNIPAGATDVTVEAFSRDDLGSGKDPASFVWVAGGFAMQPDTPKGETGRMTGGGSVFTNNGVRVTRGFQLHCDLRDPNNLQVNWGRGNKFHLLDLTGAICTESPFIDQGPPASAPFDTFRGAGTGRYNGVDGATIEFVIVDAGEPGVNDTAMFRIIDVDGDEVLSVSGLLRRGNFQAHRDNR